MSNNENPIKSQFIRVDEWTPNPEDEIFSSTGEVIICNKLFNDNKNSNRQFPYFVMKPKKGYASSNRMKGDILRIGFKEHCTQYLNYFEKFYDTEQILVGIYTALKAMIDSDDQFGYTEQNFFNDLYRYIISYDSPNKEILKFRNKVREMVDDNYYIEQTYINTKNPCLAYTDEHVKILMEISIIQLMLIPLISHFYWRRRYPKTVSVNKFFLSVFSKLFEEINSHYGVDMNSKLYETVLTNVNKNVISNSTLWEMQNIRSRDNSTQTMQTIENIILQIIPKYTFDKNIINFNYITIESELDHKVRLIDYGYKLSSISSSDRDEDSNSQADKFEAHLSKIDESLVIQSKVNCEETMKRIKSEFGAPTEGEINFYIKSIQQGGKPIKNSFQFTLVTYIFMKWFQDLQTIKMINITDYITLMIACKKYLISNGQTFLPYIIGGRVEKLVSRKTVNKRLMERIKESESYNMVSEKYNNKKIEDIIFKTISQILSSTFLNIDYYHPEHNGIVINTTVVPERIAEEYFQYILLI
jgi:hypothetical protein